MTDVEESMAFRRENGDLVIDVELGVARVTPASDADVGAEEIEWEDIDQAGREELVLGQLHAAISRRLLDHE